MSGSTSPVFADASLAHFNAQAALASYNANWCPSITSLEQALARIRSHTFVGSYSLCLHVDSESLYADVMSGLRERGFDVGHYNGGNNGIMEVSVS